MFVIRKSTSSVGVRRLAHNNNTNNRRVHSLVRILRSRSTFESQLDTATNTTSATFRGSRLYSNNNNNNNYGAIHRIPDVLSQGKESSSISLKEDDSRGNQNNKKLESAIKFDKIQWKNQSPKMFPSEQLVLPLSLSSPLLLSSIEATIIRDASLRAIYDAAMKLLRSAMESSSSMSAYQQPQGSSSSSLRMISLANNSQYGSRNQYNNFQRQSRAYYSSGPVNKGGTYSTSVKVPTPKSSTQNSMSPFGSIDPKEMAKKAMTMTWSMTKTIMTFLFRLPGNTIFYAMHPKERKEKIAEIKEIARKEFDHYWTGTKLLMADVRTARNLMTRTLSGSSLTRRERKQLLRTVSDLFRLVPFSMFILIPFMEFALPFALRIFPNLLPSTFQDSLKAEELMKRELKTRIAMAQFFQDTLEELAKEQKRIAAKRTTETPDNTIASKQEESAESMLKFLDRARKGEMLPPDVIVQYATFFQDDLTLDNMPRMQLINMCKYMSIPPYGTDSFLRFQLRHKIRILKEDDQRILWEGIESLTKMELREACQERGMRSTGLSKDAYKRSLQQWLDLSVHKNVPISLLVMSRIFFLQEEMTTAVSQDGDLKSVAGLADAISGMDKEVLNQVILEVATSEEKKSNPDVRKIKLEVLTHQNEKIKEEQAEREAAAKKKESAEKAVEAKVEQSPPAEPLLVKEMEMKTEPMDTAKTMKVTTEDMEDVVVKVTDITDKKPSDEKSTPPDEKSPETEKLGELSADEMEAIAQLLSADPVSKEREDLEKIKAAIQEKVDAAANKDKDHLEKIKSAIEKQVDDDHKVEDLGLKFPGDTSKPAKATTTTADSSPKAEDYVTSDTMDKYAASRIEEMDQAAKIEADKSTTFSTSEIPHIDEIHATTEMKEEHIVDEKDLDEPEEDPVVARLKQRIESMVDKIELQISDAEVKIGDKLHFLDKDMDGMLSREEVAEVLHQVLKRNLSMEEALEIANQIDENKDGIFTVQELIKWIETNKLIKFESEGRDADMDRVMEKQSTESSQPNTQESPPPPPAPPATTATSTEEKSQSSSSSSQKI